MIVSPVVRVMDDALELLSQTRLRINGGSDNIFAGGNVSRQGALRPVICVLFSSPQNAYCAPVLRSNLKFKYDYVTPWHHLNSPGQMCHILQTPNCFMTDYREDEITILDALTHDFNLVQSFPIFPRFTRAPAHSWQWASGGEGWVGLENIWRVLASHGLVTQLTTCLIKVTFDQVKSQEAPVRWHLNSRDFSLSNKWPLLLGSNSPTESQVFTREILSFGPSSPHTPPISHLVQRLYNYSFILTQCSITTPPLYHCCNAEYLQQHNKAHLSPLHLCCQLLLWSSSPDTFVKWKYYNCNNIVYVWAPKMVSLKFLSDWSMPGRDALWALTAWPAPARAQHPGAQQVPPPSSLACPGHTDTGGKLVSIYIAHYAHPPTWN